MGQGSSSKVASSAKPFSADSQRQLAALFQEASSDKPDWCKQEDLQTVLARKLHPEISGALCSVMWRSGGRSDAAVSYAAFVGVASCLLKSAADNHSALIWQLVLSRGSEESAEAELPATSLQLYVSRMVGSYILLARGLSAHPSSEVSQGSADGAEGGDLTRVTDLLLYDLLSDRTAVTRDMFDKWLANSALFAAISVVLFRAAFSLDTPEPYRHMLPSIDAPANYSLLMQLPEVLAFNWSLPFALRHRWRLLFSNRIHGNSFSSVLKRVQSRGPSVVVVRDGDGAMFGGFASSNWQCAGDFYGTHETFVFSISPSMRLYRATGYNENYMYMNVSQQTLPNGMGFGGKFEYFGLWISSEFGVGFTAPSCTTFDCRLLSGKKRFNIDCLEIWGVGDEPTAEDTNTRPSVLDADAESSAMLQLVKGKMHSDGLRESAKMESPSETKLPPM